MNPKEIFARLLATIPYIYGEGCPPYGRPRTDEELEALAAYAFRASEAFERESKRHQPKTQPRPLPTPLPLPSSGVPYPSPPSLLDRVVVRLLGAKP